MDPDASTTRQRLLERFRKGAARARGLLTRLLTSGRSTSAAGSLEALQKTLEAIENHIATYDLPVDTARLRARLEALLSVLLDIEDDRVAAEAAAPLDALLAAQLPRLERAFLQPNEFFPLLRQDVPKIADARAAAAADDFETARNTLAQHLGRKAIHEGLASWLLRPTARPGDKAALAARGFLRSDANEFVFAEWPVRWELAPDCAQRHDELAALAHAYATVPSPARAAEAFAHLLGWAANVPPPLAGQTSPAWTPEALSARLLNWSTAFTALRSAKAFTPEAARLAMLLAHESAEHLMGDVGHLRGDCQRAVAAAALVSAGEVFDEFTAASQWRQEGLRLLAEVAREGVLPDGGEATGSMGNHDQILAALTTGAVVEPNHPAGEAARRMLAFEKAVLLPDGTLPDETPDRKDGTEDRLSRLNAAAAALGAASRHSAAADFHAFANSGFYVMRTRQESSSEYMLLRSGSTRQLIVACAEGETLRLAGSPRATEAVEPSQHSAEGPRSTVARAGPPSDYVRTVTGLVRGKYTHRREVLFVDRRYLVLCDRVRGEAETGWTLGFEFAHEPTSSVDGRRLLAGDFLFVLASPTDCGLKAVDPDEQSRSPVYRMRAETRGSDVRFMLLMYPLRGDPPDAVTVEPLARGGTAIGFVLRRPASEDLVGFAHGDQDGLGGLPPCTEAAALSRPAGAAGSPWRTLFEHYDTEP